jgi:hypothetical protein
MTKEEVTLIGQTKHSNEERDRISHKEQYTKSRQAAAQKPSIKQLKEGQHQVLRPGQAAEKERLTAGL